MLSYSAGGKRSTIEMTVDRVHFCGPKQDNASGDWRPAGAGVDVQPGFHELDDDAAGVLPF